MTDLKQLSDDEILSELHEASIGLSFGEYTPYNKLILEIKRRLSERLEWQPMKTIPMDGTLVFTFNDKWIPLPKPPKED